MLDKTFVPKIPFAGFKWKWGSVQCTEGINDPLVLLGVLFKLGRLEKEHKKYSSPEFAEAMQELQKDLTAANINVDVAGRTGERNLMRNSGQYWKTVGLIPAKSTGGMIALTDFGRKIYGRSISKTEFSAITIQSYKLPNERIQTKEECQTWSRHGIKIYPFRIILSTLRLLKNEEIDGKKQDWITPKELYEIIIPLSACNAGYKDYANFILWHRKGEIDITAWPKCMQRSNDKRFSREFLLFLNYYNYIHKTGGDSRDDEVYSYNEDADEEIARILDVKDSDISLQQSIAEMNRSSVSLDLERKIYERNMKQYRPLQSKFRQALLSVYNKCVITNVRMPGLLEAAHIKPHKYNGPETKENGLLMRRDIHYLFDSGNLRISVNGDVSISRLAQEDYGHTLQEKIDIPDYVDKEFLRWRWENYDGE